MTTTAPPAEIVDQYGGRPLPLTATTTDVEAWRAEINARRARNAYFRGLDIAARESQTPQALAKARKATKPTKPAPKTATPKAPTVRKPIAEVRPCVVCDRPTRGKYTTAADHPGTVLRGTPDKCKRCAENRTRPDVIRPCVDCGRPTRPSSKLLADHPGTVVRVTRDKCSACFHGYVPGGNRSSVKPCVECERPTRPAHTPADAYPGTILRAYKGHCQACARGKGLIK